MFNLSFYSPEVFSAILLIFLLISHFISYFINSIIGKHRRWFTSFTGGIIAAYVFLYMLPDLIESRTTINTLLDNVTNMSPFEDLIVFMIALLGFEIFYLLERYTASKQANKQPGHVYDFTLNLLLYCCYNFLITYTLIDQVKYGNFHAVLYVISIALNFAIMDDQLKRYFPKLFNLKAHLILESILLLGYIASWILPQHLYTYAILTAFLSGSVLYTTFSSQLALTRETSTVAFFSGSVVMAALLSFLLIKP